MKKKTIALLFAAVAVVSCKPKQNLNFIEENIQFADSQLQLQVDRIEASGKILNPRTINDKTRDIKYVDIEDWTSGFFPGTMWYMYDLTKEDKWLTVAKKYTEDLDSVKYLTWHHDVGFMMECSYGNGYRLTGDTAYKSVLVQTAKSLCTRFRPNAGCIQSWDVKGWQAERGWECPVIIDNMMNLELLFNATQFTGDSTYWKIAVKHADVTMKNHFRPDNSCYHVIDYSMKDGSVRNKHTAQGYRHETAWARGQAWAIYGYTVCYRYTKDPAYLEQAKKTFDFFWNDTNMPADKVPYWDFDAPQIPNEPRDASAAAIVASALYEMSTYNLPEYRGYADTVMKSLASPAYRAKVGKNEFFLLMHSVGSIPHGHEIDVPLNYADYYFLEALKRKRDLEEKK